MRLRKPNADPRRCSRLTHGLGGSVDGAGLVKVRQNVCRSFLQGPSERSDLGEHGWNALTDRFNELDHRLPSFRRVFVAVGIDYPLVNAPGRFDLHVSVDAEEVSESLFEFVGGVCCTDR